MVDEIGRKRKGVQTYSLASLESSTASLLSFASRCRSRSRESETATVHHSNTNGRAHPSRRERGKKKRVSTGLLLLSYSVVSA